MYGSIKFFKIQIFKFHKIIIFFYTVKMLFRMIPLSNVDWNNHWGSKNSSSVESPKNIEI